MKFHFGVVAYAPRSILLQRLGFTIRPLPGDQASYCLSLLIAEQGRIFFKEMIYVFLHFLFPLLLPYNNLAHMFLLYLAEF